MSLRNLPLIAIVCLCCIPCMQGCAKPDVKLAIDAHAREQSTYDQNFNLQRQMNRKAAYDVAATQMSDPASKAALTEYAATRDKIEFMAEQNERTKAMGLIGVDTVLYSEQGNLYLLLKQFSEGTKGAIKSTEAVKAAATQPAK